MLHISNLYLKRYRLNEMTGDVYICYRKNVDHSWKTLDGSFFKQRVDGSIMMPTTTPTLLLASFEKIDIQNIKKSLSIWSKMMSISDAYQMHSGKSSFYCWVKVKQIQIHSLFKERGNLVSTQDSKI